MSGGGGTGPKEGCKTTSHLTFIKHQNQPLQYTQPLAGYHCIVMPWYNGRSTCNKSMLIACNANKPFTILHVPTYCWCVFTEIIGCPLENDGDILRKIWTSLTGNLICMIGLGLNWWPRYVESWELNIQHHNFATGAEKQHKFRHHICSNTHVNGWLIHSPVKIKL